MADIIHRCCICEADFSPGALDKDGKCPICRAQYPTVKSRKDAIALSQPNLRLGEKLDADQVRQIVREELNAFVAEKKAEFLRKGEKESKQ